MISMLFAGLLQIVQSVQAPAPAASPVVVTRVALPEKALRIEVTVPGSLDEVWAAFTTNEGLAEWLWRDVRVELRPGGDWLAVYPGGKSGGGTIMSFAPKQYVTIKAMAPEQYPAVREAGTTARFEFAVVTPTTTKVTLVQTGWKEGREWDEAYEYLADGNAILLKQLLRRFESGPLKWAPPAPSGAEAHPDFDFLEGEWAFTYTAVDPSGSGAIRVSKGRWTGTKAGDGRLLEDEFVFLDAHGRPVAAALRTFRVYNPTTHLWNYRLVNLATGVWQEGTAERVGDEMHPLQTPPQEQPAAPMLRIRYYDITKNAFRWISDASLDGGKTWRPGVATIEASRVR